MRRWFGLGGVLSVVVLTLAACSGLSPAPFDVTAGFSPTSLGFEVDDEGGITIVGHAVTFVSEPGSVGGVVTGYRMQYLDAAGVPIVEGTDGIAADDSIAVAIPPGIACETTVPCTFMATDASYQRQVSEPLDAFVTLPAQVALEFLASGTVAGTAEGHFIAETDHGRTVEIPFSLPIQYPVEP